MKTLNEVYSTPAMRRRYEVWFLRLGLADGSGAWWFRYLLMNLGRDGCKGNPRGMPVQIWASWFPRDAKPLSVTAGFPFHALDLSDRGRKPFHFGIGKNKVEESGCCGDLAVDGHQISWDLRYRSTFRVTLSNKGWIGFSRTPHSDACFSGRIILDDKSFEGEPLGFGVQGHNCGYRHRGFWIWTHAYFPRPGGMAPSTIEALVYDMPLGFTFRKAVLWHEGEQRVFRDLRQTAMGDNLRWTFAGSSKDGFQLEATVDGAGASAHRLLYQKTDCSGSFEVENNSLASATLRLISPGKPVQLLETTTGAVLERSGNPSRC